MTLNISAWAPFHVQTWTYLFIWSFRAAARMNRRRWLQRRAARLSGREPKPKQSRRLTRKSGWPRGGRWRPWRGGCKTARATSVMMPAPRWQWWQRRQGDVCNEDSAMPASTPVGFWQWCQWQLCWRMRVRTTTLPRGELAKDGNFAEEGKFAQGGDFAQEGNVAEEGGIFAKDGNAVKEGKFANEGFVVNIRCHHWSHVDERALAHNGYALVLAHEGSFQLLLSLPLCNAMAGNFSLCACTWWLTNSPCACACWLKRCNRACSTIAIDGEHISAIDNGTVFPMQRQLNWPVDANKRGGINTRHKVLQTSARMRFGAIAMSNVTLKMNAIMRRNVKCDVKNECDVASWRYRKCSWFVLRR